MGHLCPDEHECACSGVDRGLAGGLEGVHGSTYLFDSERIGCRIEPLRKDRRGFGEGAVAVHRRLDDCICLDVRRIGEVDRGALGRRASEADDGVDHGPSELHRELVGQRVDDRWRGAQLLGVKDRGIRIELGDERTDCTHMSRRQDSVFAVRADGGVTSTTYM